MRISKINLKNTFIVPTDAHYYKIIEMLKLFIYLSGLMIAVAVFRNPNTIPFCLTTGLLPNVLFEMLKQYKNYNTCSDMFRFTQGLLSGSSPVLS
jgi:hypothetical protein